MTDKKDSLSIEGKKFGQIDTLRFFSVFVVLSAHWGWGGLYVFDRIFSSSRGVNMFFVISGFLITLGLIKSKFKDQTIGASLYKFYIRRSLRIFPIYYLTLLVVWCFDHAKVADSIWWNVFYASNFYNIKTQSWGGVGHLWSLAVEEQFYLLWPFIILFTSRRFLPFVIAGAILLSEGTRLFWFLNAYPWWYEYTHLLGALDALGIGALLAYCYYFHKEKLKAALFNWYVIITVFAIVIFGQFARYQLPFSSDRFCMGIFFAWLIGRSVFTFTGVVGYILNNRVFKYIGTISYCIYLIHPIVPDIFVKLKIPLYPNTEFVTYFVTTVAIASVSWYAFESQILKLKDRFE